MKAVTTEQMRELDRRAIAAGTTVEELMERAGFAVAKAAIEFLKKRDSRSALLFVLRVLKSPASLLPGKDVVRSRIH